MPAKKNAKSKDQTEPSALTYEEGIAQLESLVERMEEGTLSLEQSLSLYEQGTVLHAQLLAILQSGERRIQMLQLQGENADDTEISRVDFEVQE